MQKFTRLTRKDATNNRASRGGVNAKTLDAMRSIAGCSENGAWDVELVDFGAGQVLPTREGTVSGQTLMHEIMQRRDAGDASAQRKRLRAMLPGDAENFCLEKDWRVPLDVALFFLRGRTLDDVERRMGFRAKTLQCTLPSQDPYTILWADDKRGIFTKNGVVIFGAHRGGRARVCLLLAECPCDMGPFMGAQTPQRAQGGQEGRVT